MDPAFDRLKRPLHDLRISVIDKCNFRCGYCMPAEIFGPDYAFLKGEQLLSFEEIVRLSRAFAALGARKIRLTGGEPLLRKGIADLVEELTRTPDLEDLALTTNGVLLPRFAEPLKAAGLERVTISIDALDDEVFRRMNGRGVSVGKALNGIEAALAAGLGVKLNMVVQRGVNEGEILPLVRRFRGTGIILRFIEFMDVGNHNGWRMEEVFPAKEIIRTIDQEFPLEPTDPNYAGEVARRYRFKDGAGEIGVIASVTQPFCRGCTRARLSADGLLYTCLFATQGWNLKEILRAGATDEEILKTLSGIWSKRRDRYSEQRTQILKKHLHPHKVEMSYIGG